MRKYKPTDARVRRIATERMKKLFVQAAAADDPKRARRYVELARKISTRNKVRLPRGSSRLFCRHCNSFFVPGKNVRIRTREGKQVYLCLLCKHLKRFPFLKERRTKG